MRCVPSLSLSSLLFLRSGRTDATGRCRQVLQPHSHLPIPPFVPSLSLSTDSSLLRTISALELLSHESNVAAFIRSGGLEEVRQEEGRRECEEASAEVRSGFDAEWWRRVARGEEA